MTSGTAAVKSYVKFSLGGSTRDLTRLRREMKMRLCRVDTGATVRGAAGRAGKFAAVTGRRDRIAGSLWR